MNIVQAILSLAANYGWELQQFDVKNSFLHEELEEEIYMEVLLGYEVAANSVCREQQFLSQHLAKEFEIKTLGRLKYFLGIEVSHSKKKYIIYLIKAIGMIACKSSSILMDLKLKLVMQMIATYRILQYPKETPNKGILYKLNRNTILETYIKADYARSVIDRRSITGYCPFLRRNLVTWRSKKQNVVVQSHKIKWDGLMKLYCDNKSAISKAHNPIQHDQMKHIEVDRHFIKEKLDGYLICTPYVTSQGQLAYILTKGLCNLDFERIICKLGMKNINSPAREGVLEIGAFNVYYPSK
ncbi:Copia protein, partial [Mucuna pruriens]